MAKKKKKAKRKTAKKKTTPEKPQEVILDPQRGLHAKKLEIMAEVPIMPCSLIGKDKQGHDFAYTRAEEVFQVYYEKCIEKGLTIRQIRGHAENAEYPDEYVDGEGTRVEHKAPCVRWYGEYVIRDDATGQSETFCGAGDGDNDIWSVVSAQTIAFKQALLIYFLTAWPQPTDMTKVVKNALEKVKPEDFVESFKQMVPDKAWEVMDAAGAVDALLKFYS